MSQVAISESPVMQKSGLAPLRHPFCKCQLDCPGGHRYSWCGVELSGKGTDPAPRPIDLCAMCRSIMDEKIPCKFCGKGSGQ